MKTKLHIPGSNESQSIEDLQLFSPEWLFTVVICLGIMIGFLELARRHSKPTNPSEVARYQPRATVESTPPASASRDLYGTAKPASKEAAAFNAIPSRITDAQRPANPSENRRRSAKWSTLTNDVIRTKNWSDTELAEVFSDSPLTVTEQVCQVVLRQQPPPQELSDRVLLALMKSTDRWSENAPWACLSQLYFADQLPESWGLNDALDVFWKEMEARVVPEAIALSVVQSFATHDELPKASLWTRWLSQCGLQPPSRLSEACLTLMKRDPQTFGSDILLALDRYLGVAQHDHHTAINFESLTQTLAHLATRGQPQVWRIEKLGFLNDYDLNFRLGAVFMLCRYVHAPDPGIARYAAEALSQIAQIDIRATDDRLVPRWQTSCKSAFTPLRSGPRQAHELLAIVDPRTPETPDQAPDYTLSHLDARGDCIRPPGYPLWACGSNRWRGRGQTLHDYLQNTYLSLYSVQHQ